MAEQTSRPTSPVSSISSLGPEDSHTTLSRNADVFSDEFAFEPPEELVNTWETFSSDGRASRSPTAFRIPRWPLESCADAIRSNRASAGFGGSTGSQRHRRPSSVNNSHPVGNGSWNGPQLSIPHRSVSHISNFSLPRSQSPYQGATEPSHPYAMYPQGVGVARSSSSSTNNTRIDRYPGSSGPTQPYGMYSQNTAPEDEIIPDTLRPVPGFPGLTQDYRRIGPDGDEAADIVGPDGYREQLPPYTRYANDIPPKAVATEPGVENQNIERTLSTPSEMINQPQRSQDTLLAPQPGIMRSNLAVDDSLTQLNPPDVTQGGHSKERDRGGRGKRRICFGKLPLWLVMTLIFIGAILLGAVIGGVLGHAKGAADQPHVAQNAQFGPPATSTITTTTLIDAVPFTSTGVPSLPTGTLSVVLDGNSMTNCLNDTQLPAWACDSRAVMNITVVDGDNMLNVSFATPISPNQTYRYGPQPPQFQGLAIMAIVKDRDDPDKGPAYFFQQSFDKLVVLRENEFPMMNSKRWLHKEYDGYAALNERDVHEDEDEDEYTQVEDKAWFCFWKGTLLEAFIFVSQDYATTTTTSTFDLPSSTNKPGHLHLVTASPTGRYGLSIPAETSVAAVPPSPGSWPRDFIPTDTMDYSKVVKIKERRNVNNEIKPYCQKMRIMEDGSLSPLEDMQNLDELEPALNGLKRRDWFEMLGFARRKRAMSKGCQCNWVIA